MTGTGVIGNTNFPVGDGGFVDFTNGSPQPANYFGQMGWWTVPTSWFSRWQDGVQYVSPNSDFSRPVYVAKMNSDYTLVFQSVMANLLQQTTGDGSIAVSQPANQVTNVTADSTIVTADSTLITADQQ